MPMLLLLFVLNEERFILAGALFFQKGNFNLQFVVINALQQGGDSYKQVVGYFIPDFLGDKVLSIFKGKKKWN